MFHYRRQVRRWAARVLLLWLFGIGAGLAHACLAANGAQPAGRGVAYPVAAHITDADAAEAPSDAHHASQEVLHPGSPCHDEAPGKTNCQDFCDKSSMSIPPLKLALDHADASALPPPAAAMLCAVPVAEPASWWVPRRDGGLAPPIPIAFLRLAL